MTVTTKQMFMQLAALNCQRLQQDKQDENHNKSLSDDLDSSVTIIEEVEASAPEDHNTTIDLSGDEDEFADLPDDLDH